LFNNKYENMKRIKIKQKRKNKLKEAISYRSSRIVLIYSV